MAIAGARRNAWFRQQTAISKDGRARACARISPVLKSPRRQRLPASSPIRGGFRERAVQKFISVTGVAVPVLEDDINTDKIAPIPTKRALKPDYEDMFFH